jgi:hypothetical protein
VWSFYNAFVIHCNAVLLDDTQSSKVPGLL